MIKKHFVYLHRRADSGEVFYVGKGTWTPLKKYIRASTTSRRNIHWKRIVTKCGGFTHEVIAEFDIEAEAFAEEIRLIAEYGKCNYGGLLCNITDGGEGHSGFSPTEETRSKMSAAARGKPKPDHVKAAVSAAQRGVPNPPAQVAAHSIRMTGAGNPNFGTKNSAETIAKRVATRGHKCSGADCHFYGKPQPEYIKAKLREANSRKVIDRATGTIFESITAAAAHVGRSNSVVQRWLAGKRPNKSTLRYA